MKFKKLLLSLLALVAIPAVAFATSPISSGGSIFPLTLVTQPMTNTTDAFNQMLILANQQLVGLSTTYTGAMSVPSAGIDNSTVAYSNSLVGNPGMQERFVSFTAAQVSAGINVLNSATGRTIHPGVFTLMVSGSASGATNVVVECSPSGNQIASFPVSGLKDGRPVGPQWTSASTASPTVAKAAVAGCSSADAVMISAPGLATTTQVFVTMPYTVQ